MTRRILYVVSIAVILLVLALERTHIKAAPVAASPSSSEVKIDNFAFTPSNLDVPVGTQVTWTNRDDIPHTVVGDDNSIKSKALDTNDKFSFTFTKPGSYPYFCSLHPKMRGTIV